MDAAQAKALRAPFPPELIGKRPQPLQKDSKKGRCNECGGWHGLPAIHLDYVGHAVVTDRLLQVDPSWAWEPVADEEWGLPGFDRHGGLWIRLTVAGVTRLGYGDAGAKEGPNAVKEAIGDAIRNAAMRFGVGLDLWSKADLQSSESRSASESSAPPAAAGARTVEHGTNAVDPETGSDGTNEPAAAAGDAQSEDGAHGAALGEGAITPAAALSSDPLADLLEAVEGSEIRAINAVNKATGGRWRKSDLESLGPDEYRAGLTAVGASA